MTSCKFITFPCTRIFVLNRYIVWWWQVRPKHVAFTDEFIKILLCLVTLLAVCILILMLPSNPVTAESVNSYDTLISLSSFVATLAYELHILSACVPNIW
jgi:hypothetical protein